MALRTITIEDDDFEELEEQVENLQNIIDGLRDRIEELETYEEDWNNKDALLTRIGEL